MNILALSQPPRLMDQARQVARLKHFSPSTEKSYLYYIHDFILFHNKHMQHPKDMGAAEIRANLTHLAIRKNVAASTQNVALSALLFLYKQVLLIYLTLTTSNALVDLRAYLWPSLRMKSIQFLPE